MNRLRWPPLRMAKRGDGGGRGDGPQPAPAERGALPSTPLLPARSEVEDEVLEAIWLLREQGAGSVSALIQRPDWPGDDAVLARLQAGGLIEMAGDTVRFTPAGEARARLIIRRHRLAERLLADLFELGDASVEAAACQFEHILSPEVTDSVCTLLGHPPRCPHGRPIPRGDCCARNRRDVRPVVLPLTDLPAGARGRVVFVTPRAYAQLDRLSALGLAPGSTVWLRQKRPAYVLRVGQTDLALDASLARDLYVRQL